MQTYVFDLQLPDYEVLRYYQGRVKTVRVRDYDGRTLEFSMDKILRFATRAGVSGTFVLYLDEDARFLGIEPLGGG